MGSRPSTRVGWLSGLLLLVATLTLPSLGARQQALVRGNAPGEWRYWGADAWSTRYSPLDQINGSNFSTLQTAWKWNGATDGEDEYYRTTPLYANGKLFTVATSRSYAYAIDPANGTTLWSWKLDEGIRWQKAPRRFAGRGLSYWTDGRGNERVIVVTPGYHMAVLDAKTGKPDPAVGKNGVVDLMEGLGFPLVPLAVDDNGPLIYSDLAQAQKGQAGRNVGQGKGDRRRRHGWARSSAWSGRGQLPGDHRRRHHRGRQLAHSRLLSDPPQESAWLDPWLRHQDRQAVVEIQSGAAAR